MTEQHQGHPRPPRFVIALWIVMIVALVIYVVKELAKKSWR